MPFAVWKQGQNGKKRSQKMVAVWTGPYDQDQYQVPQFKFREAQQFCPFLTETLNLCKAHMRIQNEATGCVRVSDKKESTTAAEEFVLCFCS